VSADVIEQDARAARVLGRHDRRLTEDPFGAFREVFEVA
jgi:hypothetical protein